MRPFRHWPPTKDLASVPALFGEKTVTLLTAQIADGLDTMEIATGLLPADCTDDIVIHIDESVKYPRRLVERIQNTAERIDIDQVCKSIIHDRQI
jgi:hypothetical protein